MELVFFRHGKAGSRSEWEGDDAVRPLSADGESDVREMAMLLRRMGVAPDAIVTSPYARAARTAEIAAEVFGVHQHVHLDPRLEPGFSVDDVSTVLQGHADADTVVLVGHNPDFEAVVGALVGGANVRVKKAGVARVDTIDPSDANGVLVWLLTPRVVR